MGRRDHTRRDLLKIMGMGAAAAALPRAVTAAPAAPDRPNVLLIMSDDQTFADNGCYGNPDVKTPNIDRLAKQGMRFTRAFTATAMCAPTRQQLYTGIFPVRNGAYPNHSRVYDGTKSIVHYHGQGRVYKDVIVQTADDPDFIRNVETVFNNDRDNSSGLGVGKDWQYLEEFRGEVIQFHPSEPVTARYVRFYSNGNSTNDLNHYVEVEVWGRPIR